MMSIKAVNPSGVGRILKSKVASRRRVTLVVRRGKSNDMLVSALDRHARQCS
jgi:hypothetical protein